MTTDPHPWATGLESPDAQVCLHAQVWARLLRGVGDRHAPARHPVLATVAQGGMPQARTVVLRAADAAAGTLDIHTDLRLRWHVPKLRLVAIAVGLAGLFIMLGGDGGVPVPGNLGEWMAFIGGFIWALATAGMRLKSDVPPLPAAFLFALGATITSFLFAPFLEPLPVIALSDLPLLLAQVLLTGGLWWGASIAALMWATLRLDPARVGILLMTEVIFGAVSAAILAGESLSTSEMIGGTLVILCGLLEVWPTKGEPHTSSA
jgi:drug/metabolite transporter (DMT)-like permease